LQLLNLSVVSLQVLESPKLFAQGLILRLLRVPPLRTQRLAGLCASHEARRSSRWWAHLDSNQGPGGYEPPALTAELWAQPRAETRCTKKKESTPVSRACRGIRHSDPPLCRREPPRGRLRRASPKRAPARRPPRSAGASYWRGLHARP